MNCPKCGYKGVPDEARFCPKCGHSVEIATRVDIRQEVERNLGRVIGVQTETIQGDVYGGDIYQVQVYALSGTGRPEAWRRSLSEKTLPYKYLSPYTAQDQALFKGRESEIEQVIRRIGEQRQVIVYGQPGVGKTSLLAAGVIPKLAQYGALVVYLQEYTQPLEEAIREALAASSDQIPIALPERVDLPALVRAICEATRGTLVLVLDQFERLFEPSLGHEGRAALIESLAQALGAVEPELLRLVIGVRAGALDRLVALQDRLPDLWRLPIPLSPLARKQAQTAIEAPLAELGYPGGVSYVAGLVPSRLVPDLDALTPEAPDRIAPSHLQIVCHWLYQAACDIQPPKPPHIDETLYRRLKGAEGIIAYFIQRTLETQLSAQWELARQLMQALASPTIRPWVMPEQLPSNGSSSDQVHNVLEQLVAAQLLVRRALNGRQGYAIASPVVARGVRLQAPPEVRRRYQASEDLERAWSAWKAHESLATRTQLRYLEEASVHLSPSPVQMLLLLRSAVASDVPDNPWPARLRSDANGPALIRQMEGLGASSNTWQRDPSALDDAKRLLGLEDLDVPRQPADGERAFGPVAWSAATHPQSVTRQTAALALTALEPYPQAVLDRLRWALRTGSKGWRHWLRKGELRSALFDADPENEILHSNLPATDRVGVWLWRARRRMFRDRQRIASLMLAGGVGAGLSLGLLRAVIGALAGRLVGVQFAMYFWWAWILGAGLSLGMALAEPLLLGRSEESGRAPPIWRAPLHPDRLPAMLATCLGTIFFGLAHLAVAWFNGVSLSQAPLVAPMGFVAGLGLSLALYGQPRAGWRLDLGRWLMRLGVAAVTYVTTQSVFFIAKDKGPAIAIACASSFYEAEFSRFQVMWWQRFMNSYPEWFDYLALVDAALVGIVLTLGITAGMAVAAAALAWWRSLADRAEN
jgi:hypothetical protein